MKRLLRPEDYRVAWITPLQIEAQAALRMLDHRHAGQFPLGRGDDYIFQAGDICGHNVVIATFPAGQEYGTGSAAALASQVKKVFPSLWFALLVGVAAGLPNLDRKPPLDIRLGDVLVGLPDGDNAGIVAYSLGKETGEDGVVLLRRGNVLAPTEPVVRSAIGAIRLESPDEARLFLPFYEAIKDAEHSSGTFADPGQDCDHLYRFKDGKADLVQARARRPQNRRTRVWYGPIGSGETLMRNAKARDKLRDEHQLIGLEMEAAGTMNRIPVGVIRGVCDYADTHKNKDWQPYAAAMAAAFAKAVMCQIPGQDVYSPTDKGPRITGRRHDSLVDGSTGTSSYAVAGGRVGNATEHTSLKRSRSVVDEAINWPERVVRPKLSRAGQDEQETPCSEDEGEDDDNISFKVTKEQVRRRKELLKSLKFRDMYVRQTSIRRTHAKTCQWFLSCPEYVDWLDEQKLKRHDGFLWIKGKPGAGKSTLMKFAVAHTEESRGSARDGDNYQRIIISFFFNARGDELERTTLGLYRSILVQLLEADPATQAVLDNLRQDDRWSIESLQECLEKAITYLRGQSVICFIDALDECPEQQVREMLAFLQDIIEVARDSEVMLHICLASRHYPHISGRENWLGLVLEAQTDHERDIISYIQGNLHIGHSAQAEEIRTEVKLKASGVFMWVVLVVGLLNQEHDRGRMHQLRERLDRIPDNLHALFRDILSREGSGKGDVNGSLLCILWVLFAREPLSPHQLYSVMILQMDPSRFTRHHMDDITDESIRRFLLDNSKGLIEVTHRAFLLDSRVEFIHESIRDFFLRENGKGLRDIWPDLEADFESLCHETLKQYCLDYLMADALTTELTHLAPDESNYDWKTKKRFPFDSYAALHVLYHAEEASRSFDQTAFIRQFPWGTWQSLFPTSDEKPKEEPSILYVLAHWSLPDLIRFEKSDNTGLQVEQTQYGTALFAAAARGNPKTIQAIFDRHAQVQPENSPFREISRLYSQGALAPASEPKIVHKQPRYSWDQNFVAAAAILGDEGVLAFVIASGHTEVDKVFMGRTPLSWAASNGHAAIIKRLHEHGAAINSPDDAGRTPLSYAAETAHEAATKQLLALGASTENQDSDGMTPLVWALKGKSLGVTKALLEHDASAEATYLRGRTPLLYAAEHAFSSAIPELLDHGAATEVQDDFKRTPLSWFAEHEEVEAVKCLLRHGATVDTPDDKGRTPLSLTAERSLRNLWASTLLVLLEHGASVESRDVGGRTPLSWAAWRGDGSVIQLLLDRGASIEARDDNGRTPLSWASSGFSALNVRLLVQAGALTEAADNNGRTPLSWAAEGGDEPVVRELLASRSKINTEDAAGRTPLWWAKQHRMNHAVINLLDEYGGRLRSSWDMEVDDD